MLSYGFFDSLNGDRKYTADQMSKMFEGLISSGIFENVGNKFLVSASSGLSVSVGTGRAYFDGRWVYNDSAVSVSLTASSASLSRYTAVVLRLDKGERIISIETIDGTASSNPVKPAIVRSGDIYDVCLAYVYVGAGATTITQANIEDTRTNTSVCGYVTGLIDQVDTSQLFLQWQTAYENYYTATKQQLDDFMAALTQELRVNTYVKEYKKTVSLDYTDSRNISLDMTGYTYDSKDLFFVSFNGLAALPTTDYTLDTTGVTPVLTVNMVGTSGVTEEVVVRVIKSIIGIEQIL